MQNVSIKSGKSKLTFWQLSKGEWFLDSKGFICLKTKDNADDSPFNCAVFTSGKAFTPAYFEQYQIVRRASVTLEATLENE